MDLDPSLVGLIVTCLAFHALALGLTLALSPIEYDG